MTPVEFLLARIAEDEADAHAHPDPNMWDGDPRGWFDPDRVLAECDAKRRIVEMHAFREGVPDNGWPTDWLPTSDFCREDGQDFPCPTLRLLALPYAAHSEFDSAWRL